MSCGKYNVKNSTHDLCYSCFKIKEKDDDNFTKEDHFENNLGSHEIHTAYIMFYGNKEKIGYTNDIGSRILEIKRKYPDNKLVYFREFVTESEARRFEAWLKELSKRELMRFISDFQNKLQKVESIA